MRLIAGLSSELSAASREGAPYRLETRGAPVGAHADLIPLTALVVCATAFYLAPTAPLFVPPLMAVVVLSWYRLDLALGLVLMFAPFFMAPKHVGTKLLPPSELFLAVDLAVAVARIILGRGPGARAWTRLRETPFAAPLLLILLAAALSTVQAADGHAAVYAYGQLVLEPIAFFCLLLAFVERRTTWWYLFGSLVAGGAAAGMVALVQLATQQHQFLTPIGHPPLARVRALYGSPDNLGLLDDRVLPIWLAAALCVSLRGARRVALWWPGLILVPTLILTFSRGAWIGVAAGSLFVFVVAFPRGRKVTIVGLVLAVAIGALYEARVVNALQVGHANTDLRRVAVWQSSLAMIRDHPMLGVGPDNFLHYYAPSHDKYLKGCKPGLNYLRPEAGPEPCLSHPHEEFLDFWLSTGVLGLFAFVWMETRFWLSSRCLWQSRLLGPERALLLGAMSAMLAALVHGLIDNSYFLMDLAVIFWFLCGFVSHQAWRTGLLPTRDDASDTGSPD